MDHERRLCLSEQVHRQQGAGKAGTDDGDPGTGRVWSTSRTQSLRGRGRIEGVT